MISTDGFNREGREGREDRRDGSQAIREILVLPFWEQPGRLHHKRDGRIPSFVVVVFAPYR